MNIINNINLKLKEIFQIGDTFQSMKITKKSESFCYFGNKRISWGKIEKLLNDNKQIKFDRSPDVEIDWTNKNEVQNYYNSFERYSTYISGGCKDYIKCPVKIENGLALYNNIYHLPFGGSYEDYCSKRKEEVRDGWYYVNLYEKSYGYYSSQPTTNYLYLYTLNESVCYTKEQIDDHINRKNYNFTGNPKDHVNYIKNLDLRQVNSKELDFIKSYEGLIFEEFLPYRAKNGIIISKWENFNNPLNSKYGLIYIDNGYIGQMTSGLNYSIMFKLHPQFSNELQYFAQAYINNVSTESLEKIAVEIKKSIKVYSKI